MTYLVDTSVLILRERYDAVATWFAQQVQADRVAICDVVALEYLNGASNGRQYDELAEALLGLHRVDIEPADWLRTRDVHRALAQQTGGGQRAIPIPDLIIAAVAGRAGMPLAHYDADYDRIGAITGQEMLWVAPRGSV